MYRINYLSRPVLITVDEVLSKAAIDESADLRFLLNSIEVAEERFIVPELGNSFYEDFIAKKNIVVTDANHDALVTQINASLQAAGKNPIASGDLINGMMVNAIEFCPANYQALWNRYLWKIIAEAVDIMAIVPSWTRTTGQGQQQNNPKTIGGSGEGSATASMKDIEYKIDNMVKSRLYPMIARMTEWLQNTGSYPLFPYTKKQDGISKKSNILLDIYDEPNPNGPDLWQFSYNNNHEDSCGNDSCSINRAMPAPTPIPQQLTIWRSIKIYVKDAPDPLKLIPVGAGKTIQAEYVAGATVTPMKIGDAAGYLAGRPFFNTIILNAMELPDEQYNSVTGTFSGGFNNNDYIKITFLDNA